MATLEERTSTGVSFGLTDEQKALRQLAHDFAEREIRPREHEYDERSTHPGDVIAKAHELGLMNVHIPRAYGGLELGAFEGMLIGEELCWGCSGIGTAIAAAGLGHGPVILAGTAERKQTGSSSIATWTRWASARPTRRHSRFRTCASPRPTASARRARASRSR